MSNIIDKIQLSGITYDIGGQGGSGVSVVEVTQAQYDALPSSAKTDTSKMYVITDAEAGDLTNYYTKTETNTLLGGKADTATTYTKTEVDNAITSATSTKQDQLVSSVNIKTINNESILGSGNIDIQGGGGKAIEAGRGISITTGETADTVSFNLPMSADAIGLAFFDSNNGGEISSGNSINKNNLVLAGLYNKIGGNGSKRVFEGNFISGWGSKIFDNTWAYDYGATYNIIFGQYNTLSGNGNALNSSIIVGDYCYGYAKNQSLFGYYLQAQNNSEHSIGQNNVSNKANTTFGDSGNTLFSVGNGINENSRHNAFEIRQNGDIYLTSGSTDIKLQDHLGGGGSSYTAGDGIDITNDVISVTGKQDTLISGTNIKTVNNESILGSGNITIQGGGSPVVELTQAQYDALQTIDPDTIYVITDAQGGDLSQYMTSAQTVNAISTAVARKVDTSAITTTITSSSTNSQVPSAKAVYDIVGNIETLLSQI